MERPKEHTEVITLCKGIECKLDNMLADILPLYSLHDD